MSIQPQLRRFDLTMIVVSLVIGVGIFRTPAMVAQSAGKEWIFYAAWITGGIISIFGALTFAEIGARLPAAGGYYRIFSTAYHPMYAFMLNWSQVIINAGSCASVAIIGAEYLCPVLLGISSENVVAVDITAIVVILILFGINYTGIKMGSRAQNILSLLKIVMIATCCLTIFSGHNTAYKPVVIPEDWNFVTAFGIALISIFFTYGGYQQTVNFGADVKDARKNIPPAIFLGVGIVIVLYLLVNFAYVQVLGFEQMKTAPLIAKDLAEALFGSTGATITSIIIFTSVLGFLNTSMMSNPRVYYAMAEDKVLPPIFNKVNTKTQVQEFGLTFFVTVMIASVFLLGSFEKIVSYVLFIDSISLACAAGALFIFRYRSPADYEGFKLKGYPFIPAIFMTVLLFVAYSTFIDDKKAAMYGIIIFIMGLPIYVGTQLYSENKNKPGNTIQRG